MAFTTYTLQTTEHPAGTLTIKLLSDLVGLTVPSYKSLKIDRDQIEQVDIVPGVTEPAQMTFTYLDDYSVYSEGFWFKVLGAKFELQLLLDEGAGNTYYFWGRPIPTRVVLQEVDLTVDDVERTGTIVCESLLAKLRDVTQVDLWEYIDLNIGVHDPSPDRWYVLFREILATSMMLGYNTTYDLEDVVVPEDDFLFDGQWGFKNISCCVDANGSSSGTLRYWFPANHASAYETVIAIAQTFGFCPRHFYDGSRHRILLQTRGRTRKNPVVLENVPPKESTYYPSSDIHVSVVSANCATDMATDEASTVRGVSTNTRPSNAERVDVSVSVITGISGGIGGDTTSYVFYVDGTPNAAQMTQVMYYDYVADAFSSAKGSLAGAMTEYIYKRFNVQKRALERTYAGLSATDVNGVTSHDNLHILTPVNVCDDPDILLSDCDTAWTAGANNATAADTSDKKVGAASAQTNVGLGAGVNAILSYITISPKNLSNQKMVGLWIKPSIAINAGDLALRLSDQTDNSAPLEIIPMPAFEADEWAYVMLSLATPEADTNIVSIGTHMTIDKGAFTLRLDEIRASNSILCYITQVEKNLSEDTVKLKLIES